MEFQDTQKINLKTIDPSFLFEPEFFERIKFQAYAYIDNKDFDGALGFYHSLESIMAVLRPSNTTERIIYKSFGYWLLRLKMFAFDNLELKEQADLLKNDIVKILQYKLDVQQMVYKSIDKFESGQIITETTKSYINIILGSEQLLGSAIDKFNSLNFRPTIANWLKQYQESINKRNSVIQPGRFDIINFLNTDSITRVLNANEKEFLKNLLEFYNWLQDPVFYNEDSEENKNRSFTNTQSFQLPDKALLSDQNINKNSTLPATPTPKSNAIIKPISDMGAIYNKAPALKQQINITEQKNLGINSSLNKPVNIQDILKSRYEQEEGQHRAGLSMGGGQISNEKLQISNNGNKASTAQAPMDKSKIEFAVGRQEKQQTQAEIDKKLEELEKRIK